MTALPSAVRKPALRRLSPGRAVFRTLTSVRFALLVIGMVVVASLAGVIIPQEPPEAADFPMVRTGFLAEQDRRFGAFSRPLERLGLFDIFHSAWFITILVVLVAAIAVCSWSRFRPAWRQLMHPQLRVGDRYFDQARHRASSPLRDPALVAASLRRQHYRVTVVEHRDARTMLYAERFRWSLLGTFVSHLSLVMFLVGGLISAIFNESTRVVAAEGTTAPVFAPDSSHHMQLQLLDFQRELDASGRERQLFSDVVVSRHGEEIARGRVSINRPLSVGGYAFHQAAFADGGAAVEVRDDAGRLVFSEVLPLTEQVAVPDVTLRKAGAVIFEGPAPPTLFTADGTGVSMVSTSLGPDPVAMAARWRSGGAGGGHWLLAVSGACDGVFELDSGQTRSCGDVELALHSVSLAFAGRPEGLPPELAGSLVELVRQPDGQDNLVLVTAQGLTRRIAQGETTSVQSVSLAFMGRRLYSGFTVRRDPGTRFIWIATALLLAGLAATFYFPYRRMWIRVTETGTSVAGVGPAGWDISEALPAGRR